MDARQRVSWYWPEMPDRIPLDDTYWTSTEERWRQEGCFAGVSPLDYFGTNEIMRFGGDHTMQPRRLIRRTYSA